MTMKCPEQGCGQNGLALETRRRPGGYTYRRYRCVAGHKFSTVNGFVCDPGLAQHIRKSDIKRTIEANT